MTKDCCVEVPDTFDKALIHAYRQGGVSWRDRIRLRYVLRRTRCCDDFDISPRVALAQDITAMAVASGALPKEGASIVQGVYTDDWYDIIQLLLDNLEKILEFVMTILQFLI